MKNSPSGYLAIPFLALLILMNGCTLFFGNIRPVEEKSTTYGILDLSKNSREWIKLDPKLEDRSSDSPDHPESGVYDMAFQSQKTASIISINSACKTFDSPDEKPTLNELSRELLLGISDIELKEENKITIDHTPALQTTLKGKINHEEMMLRTVVIQREKCIYDLMYVTRPERFSTNLPDFSRFIFSLRLNK